MGKKGKKKKGSRSKQSPNSDKNFILSNKAPMPTGDEKWCRENRSYKEVQLGDQATGGKLNARTGQPTTEEDIEKSHNKHNPPQKDYKGQLSDNVSTIPEKEYTTDGSYPSADDVKSLNPKRTKDYGRHHRMQHTNQNHKELQNKTRKQKISNLQFRPETKTERKANAKRTFQTVVNNSDLPHREMLSSKPEHQGEYYTTPPAVSTSVLTGYKRQSEPQSSGCKNNFFRKAGTKDCKISNSSTLSASKLLTREQIDETICQESTAEITKKNVAFPFFEIPKPNENPEISRTNIPITRSANLHERQRGAGLLDVKRSQCFEFDERKGVAVHLQQTYQNVGLKIRVCETNNFKQVETAEKVILLVGATGAGKTTLIYRLINYFLGATWENPQKCSLVIDPEEAKGVDQAISQTRWITAYKIKAGKDLPIPFSLTIIDTPGFGDTRDIEHDNYTIQQLHHIFKYNGEFGIQHLNAIGVVVQASLPRLEIIHSYIFDTILSFLGKDCEKILLLFITFANSQTPPVVNAIAQTGVKFSKRFKFNNLSNSTMKVENEDEDEDVDFVSEMELKFWQMGEKSCRRLFVHLEKEGDVLLQETQEVLEKKQKIGQITNDIRLNVSEGSSTIQKLDEQVLVLENLVTKKDNLCIMTQAKDTQKSKSFEKVESLIENCERKKLDLTSSLISIQMKNCRLLNDYGMCRDHIYRTAIKPSVVSTDYFIDKLISLETKKHDYDWNDKVLLLKLSKELQNDIDEVQDTSNHFQNMTDNVLIEKVVRAMSTHIQEKGAVYKYLKNLEPTEFTAN